MLKTHCPGYIVNRFAFNHFINIHSCLEQKIVSGELEWCDEIKTCNPLCTSVCFSSLLQQSDWRPMCQVLRHSVFGSVSSTAHKAPPEISRPTQLGLDRGGCQVAICQDVCVRCGCVPNPGETSFRQMRPLSGCFSPFPLQHRHCCLRRLRHRLILPANEYQKMCSNFT